MDNFNQQLVEALKEYALKAAKYGNLKDLDETLGRIKELEYVGLSENDIYLVRNDAIPALKLGYMEKLRNEFPNWLFQEIVNYVNGDIEIEARGIGVEKLKSIAKEFGVFLTWRLK